MGQELVPIDPALRELLKGSFGEGGLPLPFLREIFLLECHVAGTTHRDLKEAERGLAPKDPLLLLRQPDNPHDGLAIRITDREGRMLGYVPRERNEVLARLMDAGKILFGVLEGKSWRGNWLFLTLRIYLRDL
jgi:hypothetical protein